MNILHHSWQFWMARSIELLMLYLLLKSWYPGLVPRAESLLSQPPQKPLPFVNSSDVTDLYTGDLTSLKSVMGNSELAMVLLYAPWCVYSQHASRVFAAVAAEHAQLPFVAINCWEGNCRSSYKLRTYPEVFAYTHRPSSATKFTGTVSRPQLSRFVSEVRYPWRAVNNWHKAEQTVRINTNVLVFNGNTSSVSNRWWSAWQKLCLTILEATLPVVPLVALPPLTAWFAPNRHVLLMRRDNATLVFTGPPSKLIPWVTSNIQKDVPLRPIKDSEHRSNDSLGAAADRGPAVILLTSSYGEETSYPPACSEAHLWMQVVSHLYWRACNGSEYESRRAVADFSRERISRCHLPPPVDNQTADVTSYEEMLTLYPTVAPVVALWCQTNRTLNFYTLDESAGGLASTFSVHNFPTLIVLHKDEEFHRLLSPLESLESVVEAVVSFTAAPGGSQRRTSPPARRCHGNICDIDAESFNDVVMDDNKDVVLCYHSHSCGFCKSFNKIFISLAHHFSGTPEVLFARIETSGNDMPRSFAAPHIPALVVYPAGDKTNSQVVPLRLLRSLPSLVRFIETHARLGPRLGWLLDLCGLTCLWKQRRSLTRHVTTFRVFLDSFTADVQQMAASYPDAAHTWYLTCQRRRYSLKLALLQRLRHLLASTLSQSRIAAASLPLLRVKVASEVRRFHLLNKLYTCAV